MAIKDISNDYISKVIADNLTPSLEISTPERLFGRSNKLRDVERALNSLGRPVFIYGDRGVGKSSLALTAANVYNEGASTPIRVVCGKEDTFAQVIQAIGNSVTDVTGRIETGKKPGQFGITSPLGGFSLTRGAAGTIQPPNSLNEALDIIKYTLAKRSGNFVIIIDEMERLSEEKEREKFAEFIKNIPNVDHRVKFIFCEIAANVSELVGTHPSAGRIMEPVELQRLHHDSLWEILNAVAQNLGVTIQYEMLVRISQISDGFPSYVHLIGDSLFWSVFDDPAEVTSVKLDHFKKGISGALKRSEATLRQQYELATRKTKNTVDYEEALWALADRHADQRQLSDIYATYRRIMSERKGRNELDQETLNQRFHALRKPTHGQIVTNFRAGWWGFRENIIRGYVRLKAQEQGIELGKDHGINDR